ncbi:hypothetical protein EWM64_g2730 [Hericium alpestre]|uniref:Uncharacterized protein n=1 Tax=Hericium alpestre TaxID=135208 RepID=A0A4Z0A2L9_9AGAM|nr:hypothetical protein EWM64_g2730 [Hericium alpestre]
MAADLGLLIDSGLPAEMTLDGGNWELPEAVYAIQRLHQDGKLPFLKEALTVFFEGAIYGWGRFMTEFAAGGRIDQATPHEHEAAFVRATNDHNEGCLRKWCTAKCKAPALSLEVWNAKMMHKNNHTDEWLSQNSTSVLDNFIAQEAWRQDKAGISCHTRTWHVQEQKDWVARNKEKRQKAKVNRTARTDKLNAYTPNLDSTYWTDERHDVDIKDMLSWLRALCRKHLVQVPTGLTKTGVGKEGRLKALVELLRELTDDQKAMIMVSGDDIPHAQAPDVSEDLVLSEGEESVGTDKET